MKSVARFNSKTILTRSRSLIQKENGEDAVFSSNWCHYNQHIPTICYSLPISKHLLRRFEHFFLILPAFCFQLFWRMSMTKDLELNISFLSIFKTSINGCGRMRVGKDLLISGDAEPYFYQPFLSVPFVFFRWRESGGENSWIISKLGDADIRVWSHRAVLPGWVDSDQRWSLDSLF